MHFADTLFGRIITESLGWFIVHSLWQGMLIAVLLFVTLLIFRRWSAQMRYYVSFLALLLMVVSSALTFKKSFNYANEKIELKESILNDPNYLVNYIKENKNAIARKSSFISNESFNFKRTLLRAEIQKHFPWIVSIWIIGLAFYFLRIFYGLMHQYQLKRRDRLNVDPDWISKMEEFAHRLNIRKNVEIYLSGIIKSPVTTGFLKPVILVPLSMFSVSAEGIWTLTAMSTTRFMWSGHWKPARRRWFSTCCPRV